MKKLITTSLIVLLTANVAYAEAPGQPPQPPQVSLPTMGANAGENVGALVEPPSMITSNQLTPNNNVIMPPPAGQLEQGQAKPAETAATTAAGVPTAAAPQSDAGVNGGAGGDVPPELLKLLQNKNVQLVNDASEAEMKKAADEKAKQELFKKNEDMRHAQEEQLKKKQVELEISPPILYRKPYDHKASGSSQLYKKRYGSNNKHLPVIIDQDEYSRYLFAAAVKDDIGSIAALLRKGADLNARSAQHGYTPLMYAVQNHKHRAVSYLVTHGADLDVVGLDGRNALSVAEDNNDEESYGLLLSAGARHIEVVSTTRDYYQPEASPGGLMVDIANMLDQLSAEEPAEATVVVVPSNYEDAAQIEDGCMVSSFFCDLSDEPYSYPDIREWFSGIFGRS
ncbi:MAG: ankyrin repeat domain-containing protein [Proteobacteria bacterium]|nr:ankyrin repeat domain-containing protein [Pseudomonadota bacterium]